MAQQEKCDFPGGGAMGSSESMTGSTTKSASSMESPSSTVQSAASQVGSRARQTADKVSGWSRQKLDQFKQQQEVARGKLTQRASDIKERMRDSMDRMKTQVDHGRQRATEIVEEYPLVVGACALAVGIIIGLSIPVTRRERRMIGDKAARLQGRVRDTARNVYERGKQVAQHTIESVKNEAERQGLTSSEFKSTAKESVEDLGERLGAVAERGKDTLKDELAGESGGIGREFDEPGRAI